MAREEIGDIVNLCDTVIYTELRESGEKGSEDKSFDKAVKSVTEHMIKTWNDCLEGEKNKKIVTEIYLNSLILAYIAIVEKNNVTEGTAMVFENVFRRLHAKLYGGNDVELQP